jgi:ATP/maltotriose-dependent transcriptional regulator MalT
MLTQAAALGLIALADTFTLWAVAVVLLGAGTAMVYPTLLAVIGDVALPTWRARAVGVYRLWRDDGFAVGAIVSGVVADLWGLRAAVWVRRRDHRRLRTRGRDPHVRNPPTGTGEKARRDHPSMDSQDSVRVRSTSTAGQSRVVCGGVGPAAHRPLWTDRCGEKGREHDMQGGNDHPKARVRTLVGREQETTLLERALDRPREHGIRVIEVVGEPGIGKSRMLGVLRAEAARRGWVLLAGHATESDRRIPFGVLADAMADRLASLDPQEDLCGLEPDLVRELATLFPSVLGSSVLGSESAAPDDARPGLEHHRSYRAMRVLLERLSSPAGLVLVLDDVHWADDASLELLGYLLRHPPRAPVVLALAYRPGPACRRITAVLAQAMRQGTVHRIELGPLRPDDVAAFLGPEASQQRCMALLAASGGNPFYLEALADLIGECSPRPVGADLAEAVQSLDDVPPAVRACLHAELAALPEPVRVVAHAAAVAGDPFEPDLAAAVAGTTRQETDNALDELVGRHLLRPTESGRFAYRHPIVRAAAREDAGAGWLVQAHARAWDALQRRGASMVRRAHHAAYAAQIGDERAITVLTVAARTVAARAPAEAGHWLSMALRLLPDEGEDNGEDNARHLELLGDMAAYLGISGRLWEARDALHEVLRLLPRGAVDRRVRAAAFCARLEHLLGRHAEAIGLLLAELRELPQQEDAAAVSLKLALAAACLQHGDFTAAQAWANAADTIARVHDNPAALAGAAGIQALTNCFAADVPAGRGFCDRAAQLADGLTDGELAGQLDVLHWLGWAEQCIERYDEARRHLERGLTLARATGRHSLLTSLLVGHGSVLARQGRLREAARSLADAEEAAVLVRSPLLHAWALAKQCTVAALTGDIEQALRCGEQACQLAESRKDWLWVQASASLARARLAADDPERCLDHLTAAGGGPELPRVASVFRPECFELLTTAALALDRHAEAEQWATHAEQTATELALPGQTAFARLARARALHARSDTAAASAAARAAAAEFTTTGNPLDQGRARLVAADAMHALGQRQHALEELERARTLFDRCGALGLRDQAARRLRRLGRRVPRGVPGQRNPRDAVGPAALTRRESEVAELVATGLSSRQIAAKLYLSPRTVEHHVGHVLTKLGVAARSGIAAAIYTAGGKHPADAAWPPNSDTQR